MKQRVTSDFPITVRSLWPQEPDIPAELLDGAYHVQLNHTVDVLFVPEFARGPGWPPPAGSTSDEPWNVARARSYVAMNNRYTVTPSAAEHGMHYYDDPEWPVTLVLVAAPEFATLVDELAEWVDSDGLKVSKIADLRVTRLLVDELIPSQAFDPRDRFWLTD